MFSIGEFSKISGLPVRTLRFYHQRGLLLPAAVDVETGYRSYDERNLDAARVIVALQRMDFPLDEIADMLAGAAEDADILEHLERQKTVVAERMRKYREAIQQIERVIDQQRVIRETETMKTKTFEIEERNVEPMLVAGMRMKGRYQDIGQGFAKLGKRISRHIAGKPLCLYYDGEYCEEDADFEPCMPIRKRVEADGIAVRDLPGCRCVTLMHRGPYEELSGPYARIMRYAKEHGHEIELPTREVYHKGPGMIFRGNPEKYLTEIQLPVAGNAK